jgi:hypothetical protein
MQRWTKDTPAPDAIGFMVALDRKMSGSPWSARKLAEYAGWSRWKATQQLNGVKTFYAEWHGEVNQPLPTARQQPPRVSNVGHLQVHSNQEPAREQPETSHHARASYKNTTEQEQLKDNYSRVNGQADSVASPEADGWPSPLGKVEPSNTKEGHSSLKSEPVDITGLWEQMEDVRMSSVKGGRRAKLGKRRDTLRLRVNEHGADVVLHAWSWLWQSRDHRAQYLRDNGYGISTFLRASKLRDYVDKADQWTPGESVGGSDWFSEDDFDEFGNVRNTGGQEQ